MNRFIRTILSAFLAALLLFGALAISAAAAEQAVLFDLDERRNMAISVSYEKDPPDVSFVAPNGDEYGSEAVSEGKMEFYDSGSALYFRIPDAMTGEWKIVYDKKNNSELEVNCAPYAEAISIESFSFSEGSRDGELKVKFKVTEGDGDSYYNYVLWAVTMENGSVAGQTQLHDGGARLGEEYETTVNISSLATYSDYWLMLEVYRDSNGVEVFDTLVSEKSFSHTATDAPEAMEDFKVEVGMTDNYIRMDWSEYSKYYCDSYIVAIIAEGRDEPLYTAELDSGETSAEILADLSGVDSITCQVAYKDYGEISEYAVKTVDISEGRTLSFVCDEVTSAAEGKVEYDFSAYGGAVIVSVDVNGDTGEVRLEGAGSFSVNLDEYDNDIKLRWDAQSESGVTFTVSAGVYSDRKAPILRLYEMTGGLVTEESSFILAGSTEPGCTVSVGDRVAEVDSNGLFSVKLDLADGVNEFTVTATTKSGNSSKQVITIEKLAPVVNTADAEGLYAKVLSYLPMIISFLFATALCIFVFANSRYYSKKKEKCTKGRAVGASLRNICIFIGAVALICSTFFTVMTVKSSVALNSSEFLEAASESVTKAGEMIKTRDAWRLGMIISYIVLAVSVGIAGLCGWLSSEKRGAALKKPKPPKAPKTTPAAPVIQTPGAVDENKPALKYCPKCGAQLPMQAKFCGKCGYKF